MDYYAENSQDPILYPPALVHIVETNEYVPFKQKMLDRMLHNQEAYTRVARRIVTNNNLDLGAKDKMLRAKVKEVRKEYKEKMKEVKVRLSAPNLSQNETRRLKKKRYKLDKKYERDMITLKDAFDLVTLRETSDFSDTSSDASVDSDTSAILDPGVFSVLSEINN